MNKKIFAVLKEPRVTSYELRATLGNSTSTRVNRISRRIQMQHWSLLLGVLLFANCMHAQLYVGVEAGANRNYLVTNTADKPFFDYQPSYGYSIGIPVRYQFASLPWFGGIQAIPSLVQKNYRMQRTGYYSEMYQQNDNNYLELPLMAQFRFGGHFGKQQSLYGMLNLGGFGGYWLNGHVS